MTRDELITAVLIGGAVAAWASQAWHAVPPEAIGMITLAAMFAAGVLAPADIGTGIPWALAIFVGGMLSLNRHEHAENQRMAARLHRSRLEPFVGARSFSSLRWAWPPPYAIRRSDRVHYDRGLRCVTRGVRRCTRCSSRRAARPLSSAGARRVTFGWIDRLDVRCRRISSQSVSRWR